MKNATIDTSRLESRLSEACDALWDMFVDPREAYLDDDGSWWKGLSVSGQQGDRVSVPFSTAEQLAEIRQQSRHLAATNEFAINGIENRISYLVGSGHLLSGVGP